jgi:hypothetical protein
MCARYISYKTFKAAHQDATHQGLPTVACLLKGIPHFLKRFLILLVGKLGLVDDESTARGICLEII